MKPIFADEVVKIISKLNQDKSLGHDGIVNLIVKKVASVISKPLTDISNRHCPLVLCQNSLNLLRLNPSIKKRILKYSHITVLSLYYLAFQKISERLVFNRCMDYINKNNLLNEKQFGFRPIILYTWL